MVARFFAVANVQSPNVDWGQIFDSWQASCATQWSEEAVAQDHETQDVNVHNVNVHIISYNEAFVKYLSAKKLLCP